jgi:hypothetical protein
MKLKVHVHQKGCWYMSRCPCKNSIDFNGVCVLDAWLKMNVVHRIDTYWLLKNWQPYPPCDSCAQIQTSHPHSIFLLQGTTLLSRDTGCKQKILYSYSNIYICNCFLLHNTVTSNAYLYHHIDTYLESTEVTATSKYRNTWWHRVSIFCRFLNIFFFKSGMVIDHKCKYK